MVEQNTQPTSQGQGSGLDPKLASVLCYLCSVVTGLVFLLIEKQNKTVRFHAWHSIVFGGFTFAVSIVMSIFSTILINISFAIYSIFSILYTIFCLGLFVVWIVLMVKAYQGSVLNLPVLTDLARKQANK